MDLIDFLYGSEGCFGAVFSLTLRLLREPGVLWGLMFFFPEESSAVRFGRALSGSKSENIKCAEYYDSGALRLLREHRAETPLLAKLPDFPETASAAIYAELAGDDMDSSYDELAELIDLFTACGGGEDDTWAETAPASVERFRNMRHAVPAILNELPGIRSESTGQRFEICFSGSSDEFPEFISMYREALNKFDLKAVLYGHMLLNRLNLALLPGSPDEQTRCGEMTEYLAGKVMERRGKLLGEYGAGRINLELVRKHTSPEQREKLKALRLFMDPKHIMNP